MYLKIPWPIFVFPDLCLSDDQNQVRWEKVRGYWEEVPEADERKMRAAVSWTSKFF